MATYSGRRIAALVLLLGFGIGGVASWFLIGARPQPAAFVDAVATPDGALAIRRERTGTRGFVELWRAVDGRLQLVWSGLIPTYAGKPGVQAAAATRSVATVRVIRGGHPHLFTFDLVHGSKIDSFDLDPTLPTQASAWSLPTVATTGADSHAIEALATADGGSLLIAVDLAGRRLVWRKTLPWAPEQVWIVGDTVGAAAAGHLAGLALATGAEVAAPPAPAPGLGLGLSYDPARRELRAATGQVFALPADAVTPQPYHVGHGVVWIVTPAGLQALAADDLQPLEAR